MKTTTQNKIQKQTKTGLLSSPEQLTTKSRPQIDLKRRHANRVLNTDKILALLQQETPSFFQLAEVVGKWVWIQFDGKQPSEITCQLSELGFHWNNTRQVWQHPGGTIVPEVADYDPRKRYGSYFAARQQAA
jgi:hypothetical protein